MKQNITGRITTNKLPKTGTTILTDKNKEPDKVAYRQDGENLLHPMTNWPYLNEYSNYKFINNMKKTAFILLSASLLSIGFISCKKDDPYRAEEQIKTFTAAIEGFGAKTEFTDGVSYNWADSDRITIWSGSASLGSTFRISSGYGTQIGRFSYSEGNSMPSLSAPYTAVFPAAAWSEITYTAPAWSANGKVLALRSTQNYVQGKLLAPMCAISEDSSLNFKNVCGLVKISAIKPKITISSITIKTDSPIFGNFDVSYNGDNPTLSYMNGGGNTIRLHCATPTDISSTKDFYIYLPEGTYSNVEITLYSNKDKVSTYNLSNTLRIERSRISAIAIPESDLNFEDFSIGNTLNEVFSVTGSKKVYFSTGNLQYVNGEWKFAEHQYDILGRYDANVWDLFSWSTVNNDYGMCPTMSANNSEYAGSFIDWGHVAGSGWRTLNKEEWEHLLSRNNNCLRGVATLNVNGTKQHGLIILPDNWEINYYKNFRVDSTIYTLKDHIPTSDTDSVKFDTIKFQSVVCSGYSVNEFSQDIWESIFESHGAVFLPAAGYRHGNSVIYANRSGNYWSETEKSNSNFVTVFGLGNAIVDIYQDKNGGRSVRLVKNR